MKDTPLKLANAIDVENEKRIVQGKRPVDTVGLRVALERDEDPAPHIALLAMKLEGAGMGDLAARARKLLSRLSR